MKTTSAKSKNVNTKAAKQQVENPQANSLKRVVETRDMYEVIFNHSVSLVVAYALGQTPEKPREGFAFGSVATQPHTRGYAKSLIWGFVTSKAGKVLKDLDEVAKAEDRKKIAIAILTDCNLVKGDSKAIEASLAKVEPKRERVFAESVLAGLKAAVEKPATAPKGSKAKGDETKATTPKGGKAKGESKPKTTKATAPKGSKAKGETKAAPKGAKANGKAKAGK